MGGRSWPAPNENDIMISRTGIEMQAEAAGLDLSDPGVRQFIDNQVAVNSELMAEARHLQNLFKPENQTPRIPEDASSEVEQLIKQGR